MDTFYKYFFSASLMIYLTQFIVKNISTAKKTKHKIKGDSTVVKLFFVANTLLYFISSLIISKGVNFMLAIKWIDYEIVKIIGLIFVSTSLILAYISLISMGNSWRMGTLPEQKTTLVTNGIFRFSRNPFFVSHILIFLGFFLAYPTYIYLVIFLIWITLIHLMILEEEKHLIKQHGNSYKEYKSKVNRYITLNISTK